MIVLTSETHQITAGGNFNATLPVVSGRSVDAGHVLYAPQAAGGLFRLQYTLTEQVQSVLREVYRISLKLGGQASWSISILRGGVTSHLLLTGTTDSEIILTDRIFLATDDQLAITTVGAVAAMEAEVVYQVGGLR